MALPALDINVNDLIPGHDLVFITLDTLRYDVAQRCHLQGLTPNLSALIGPDGWELRHSPATFTYAAHQAFFAGFLPTPASPGHHPRLFAARFPGSETTSPHTLTLDSPNIVAGLASLGYHTICIGGVGFFNMLTPLGSVLPSLFHQAHWSPLLGVTEPRSTYHQLTLAASLLNSHKKDQNIFLFINISALHQPNKHYLKDAPQDTIESHAAALQYVDSQLPLLTSQLRSNTLLILLSDHGTAYGEDHYYGHRLAHPTTYNVPYKHILLNK
jgi:hypothetical protein